MFFSQIQTEFYAIRFIRFHKIHMNSFIPVNIFHAVNPDTATGHNDFSFSVLLSQTDLQHRFTTYDAYNWVNIG